MTTIFLHLQSGQIKNRPVAANAFRKLADGCYKVTIEKAKKRSSPQNKFYWGVACEYVKTGLQDAGFEEVRTAEDAHEIMKHLFLKRRIENRNSGEVIEIAGSTTELSTTDFNNYIENIARWAAEYLNVTIPLPGEQAMMFAHYDSENNLTIVTPENI